MEYSIISILQYQFGNINLKNTIFSVRLESNKIKEIQIKSRRILNHPWQNLELTKRRTLSLSDIFGGRLTSIWYLWRQQDSQTHDRAVISEIVSFWGVTIS